jgi:hypothetical protein
MSWYANQKARHEAAQARPGGAAASRKAKLLSKDGTKGVVMVTVKGEKEAASLIEAMMGYGYEIQNQDTRKVMFSLATGVFTRKQKHTFTFVKRQDAAAAETI